MDLRPNPPLMEGPPGALTRVDGREYLYFGGTGYLGLAGHAPGPFSRAARRLLGFQAYGIVQPCSRARPPRGPSA